MNYSDMSVAELADLAQLKDQEIAKLTVLCRTDDLTGLLNRRGILEQLDIILRELAQGPTLSSEAWFLVYIDLNKFKRINDELGHTIGDEVIRVIGGFITDSLGDKGYGGRIGGDEFILIVKEQSKEATRNMVRAINERIERHRFDFSFPPDGRRAYMITFAYGVTRITSGVNAREIIGRADELQRSYKNASSDGDRR